MVNSTYKCTLYPLYITKIGRWRSWYFVGQTMKIYNDNSIETWKQTILSNLSVNLIWKGYILQKVDKSFGKLRTIKKIKTTGTEAEKIFIPFWKKVLPRVVKKRRENFVYRFFTLLLDLIILSCYYHTSLKNNYLTNLDMEKGMLKCLSKVFFSLTWIWFLFDSTFST